MFFLPESLSKSMKTVRLSAFTEAYFWEKHEANVK